VSRRRLLLAALLLFALGVGAAAAWVNFALEPVADAAPERIFEVAPGRPLAAIARDLEREGLVKSALAVEWLARLRGLAGELQTGEYRLSGALAPREILERIASGRVATYEVVLPEGLTAAQIGERLAAERLVDAERFAAVVRDAASAAALGVQGDGLEGYLFPETYFLARNLPPLEVARVLVNQFLTVWREIEPLASAQGLSMREVVTLASIVEKETGAPGERPLIAAVFRNRLARGMRLETDPTVIYGIEAFDGNLRRRHLEDPGNPYNTYLHTGLPPGPIANPGADALRAVVRPADSEYLFFVSKNDGTHTFSRTYREHVLAVNRFQRRN
jgi:UPF0755 protein